MPASPVILLIAREPRSQNANNKGKYQADLADQARSLVKSPLLDSRLYSKVWYFYREANAIDADNLSKPILDALQGIAYQNDKQVVLRIAAKVATDVDTYDLTPHPAAVKEYARFLQLLSIEPHLLYIEIGELTNFRVTVGGAP